MRDVEIDEAALERAARQLNRARLTKPKGPNPGKAFTVDSVLRGGLGVLFSDTAVRYILRKGLQYYERERGKNAAR